MAKHRKSLEKKSSLNKIRKQCCKDLVMILNCSDLGVHQLQSKSFNSVGRNISALVGCIKKLRALYEVQLLETFQIQQMDLH